MLLLPAKFFPCLLLFLTLPASLYQKVPLQCAALLVHHPYTSKYLRPFESTSDSRSQFLLELLESLQHLVASSTHATTLFEKKDLKPKKTSRATSVALVLTRPLVIKIAVCQSFAVQFQSPNPGSFNHLRRPGSLNLPPKKNLFFFVFPLPNFFIRENKLLILVARIKSIICFVKTLAVHIKKHMKFIVNLDFFSV